MRWKPTWILLGAAAALFGFILLFERHLPEPNRPPPRLLAFKPGEVTNIQVRLTNQLILTAARARVGANAPLHLTFPVSYPARHHAIQPLLNALADAIPQAEISAQELKSGKRSIAEFGLDVPQATLTLHHNGQRLEIFFGAQTPVGDGVYVQVLNQSPIYILSTEFVNALPRTFNDWRDLGLLSSTGFRMNRIEIRSPGRGFTVDINLPTQKTNLIKPIIARADPAKLEAVLQKLMYAQVVNFVSDGPRVDLEAYGLQPPQAEVLFFDTNDLASVQFALQFGSSPTNDPTNVYCRRPTTTNIVLVPRAVLEAIQISHADVRDLHLLSFQPNAVDVIEVTGDESFAVRRQTNGTWMITEPKSEPADTNAIREWLNDLLRLEGAVEKDVVTDFGAPYGLNPPARRYLLKAATTNATGAASDQLLAELDLGNTQGNRVFARRPDEDTLYSLSRAEVARLPRAAWQLRSRRVWSFTTNQIHRVTVRHRGQTKTLQRNPNTTWTLAEGSGIVPTVNPVLEEIMFRLGELRASAWVDRGDANRLAFGFSETSDRIAIELRNGEKAQTLVLELGKTGISPTQLPYALAEVDGQTWIFEPSPPTLYFDLIRYLFQPLFPPAAPPP
jgi:hypothetical protein